MMNRLGFSVVFMRVTSPIGIGGMMNRKGFLAASF
jgi:hypothetical protein